MTAEWRNYVRPILWRCQWLELRMRELSSQVSKYDRELALNKKQKELQAASKANGSMSESMQIHKGHGNSIMKRTKRKRHEENLDTPLYINKHQILSYYHGLASNYVVFFFVEIGHQFICVCVNFAPGFVHNDNNSFNILQINKIRELTLMVS